MWLINYLFLTIGYNNRDNTLYSWDINKNNMNNDYLKGFDQRFLNSTDYDPITDKKIKKYFRNQRLVKKLNDSNINDIKKLDIITENYILDSDCIVDLTAGGLMDDFNFDISH